MGVHAIDGSIAITKLDPKTIARLFSQIEIDHTTGCWNWLNTLTKTGYGLFHYGGRKGRRFRVHRFMYAWLIGPVPSSFGGLEFDHFVCNNRKCCNPFHIKLVTHTENSFRSRKTYCKRGHLMAPSRVFSTTKRGCILCERIRSAKYRSERRAKFNNSI